MAEMYVAADRREAIATIRPHVEWLYRDRAALGHNRALPEADRIDVPFEQVLRDASSSAAQRNAWPRCRTISRLGSKSSYCAANGREWLLRIRSWRSSALAVMCYKVYSIGEVAKVDSRF
jgi:hypothetical protein